MHELRNERQLAKRNVLPRKKYHCEEDAKKSRADPQLLFRKLLTHVLRSHLSRLVVTGRMLVQGLLRELAAASVGAVRAGVLFAQRSQYMRAQLVQAVHGG